MIAATQTTIIDVREKDEPPFVDEFKHLQLPLSELMMKASLIHTDKVVMFCQSGKRSLQAAKLLNELLSDKNVYSLKGGIVKWKNYLNCTPNKISQSGNFK